MIMQAATTPKFILLTSYFPKHLEFVGKQGNSCNNDDEIMSPSNDIVSNQFHYFGLRLRDARLARQTDQSTQSRRGPRMCQSVPVAAADLHFAPRFPIRALQSRLQRRVRQYLYQQLYEQSAGPWQKWSRDGRCPYVHGGIDFSLLLF